MIQNFEDITHELNEYEMNTLLPRIVDGLSRSIGPAGVISNRKACEILSKQGFECGDARWRKIIHHIRVNHLVTSLIASKKGYYRATTRKEVQDFIESLYQRKRSIEEIIEALEVDLLNF